MASHNPKSTPVKHGNVRRRSLVRGRPKNLNLTTIRLPLPALISILHRVSGVALFLFIPVMLYLLYKSLNSEPEFQSMLLLSQYWLSKLLLLGIAWAYIHHFLAGLRHLAHDAHLWSGLTQARYTGKLVLGLSLICTILVASSLAGYRLW